MGFLGGLFKRRGRRYDLSEDDKFYLMNCSDLLGELASVIDGIVAMHDFFWEKITESNYEKVMQRCRTLAKSALSEASYIKAPERFKTMHEHLLRGLKYFDDSYVESLIYLTDHQGEHIAKAIELALLGSAELRDGNKMWERIKDDTRRVW